MHRFAFSRITMALCSCTALLACGGSTPAADEPGSTQSAATESATEKPALAWKDMNREQRMEFMGVTLMPKMKTLFQQFDPEGFKDFGCKTCHGDDMKDVDFVMPNSLSALMAPDPIPGAMEHDAETTQFMLDKVVPEMRALLQESEAEFNCFSCHSKEGG